ncbi:MAG: hypothetical protein ABSE62_08640 [Chthoniobacteraceae bacterium]|jgi:hypothetical protein
MEEPQTTNTTPTTAATTGAPDDSLSPVTVAGAVPPALARQFQSVPLPQLPEVARLPRPRERCPITGASRTWLIETDEGLPPSETFLFRVRQRGKRRGAVFINVPKLLAFLRKAEKHEKRGGL